MPPYDTNMIADVLDTMTVPTFDQSVAARAASAASVYDGLPLGLPDATLVVHTQDYRTRDLFTVDQRHFRAVRPLWGGDSFRLLPLDT